MWAIIIIGIALAFILLPPVSVFPSPYSSYLTIISIPIFVAFLYYLVTAIYFRTRFPLASTGADKIIKAGVYGRVAHPTCITLVIVGWIFFIFSPDWRILASNLWLTLVVLFWIKVEKDAFVEKPKKSEETDTMG
jgi:protein-S-isoprenylcysteine O-methyltransferase Ste14